MKLALAIGWYYPDGRGGTEGYAATLAHAARAAGHVVHVVAPQAGLAGTRTYEHEGIPVFRYGTPVAPTRDEVRGTVAARGAEALHAWVQRERPDLVHVHAFVTGLGLAEVRAARAAGARVQVTSHAARLGWLCERGTLLERGTTPCDGRAEPARCAACVLAGQPAPIGGAVAAVPVRASAVALAVLPGRAATLVGLPALIEDNLARQRALFDEIEAFVTLTAFGREVLVANGAPAAKVHVNRLGCVPPAGGVKPGPDAAPTAAPVTVGYVGRFDQVKGLDLLAAALTRLPRTVPLRVAVHGPVDTDDERAVRDAFVAAVGDDPRVTIGGAVSREALGDVLRGFDLLACPSRTFEGGPTVAIEAMAVGTPVLGAAVGALRELVHDGTWGRLVPPEDADALAAALREVAERPALVDGWRRALPPARTMDDVTAQQLALYHG